MFCCSCWPASQRELDFANTTEVQDLPELELLAVFELEVAELRVFELKASELLKVFELRIFHLNFGVDSVFGII